jgi:hypothetical protein
MLMRSLRPFEACRFCGRCLCCQYAALTAADPHVVLCCVLRRVTRAPCWAALCTRESDPPSYGHQARVLAAPDGRPALLLIPAANARDARLR